MSYEESFLSTCNSLGEAPSWAINQIFEEHGSDIDEYVLDCEKRGVQFDDGQAILNWLGY